MRLWPIDLVVRERGLYCGRTTRSKSASKRTRLVEVILLVFGLQLFPEATEEATDDGCEDGVGDREFSCVDTFDSCGVGDLLGVVTWENCDENARVPCNSFAVDFLLRWDALIGDGSSESTALCLRIGTCIWELILGSI
jgi:hypothetical protein